MCKDTRLNVFTRPFVMAGMICFLFLMSFCENTSEEISRMIDVEQANVEHATSVEILYSDSAVVRVKIVSDVMLNYLDHQNPRREFPQGVMVTFFDGRGNEQNYLTAKYAIRYEMQDKVILRDSVVLTGVDGEVLETEELIWIEAQDRIYSDKQVRITTEDEVIVGVGFESNQDFTQWEIRRITGQFRMEDDL